MNPLLLSLIVTIFAFAIVWAAHLPLKNVGVVDFYWGPGFVIVGLIYLMNLGQMSIVQYVFLTLVCLWAARLSIYLIGRFFQHPVEDARYASMRQSGGQRFWWASLFKIFVLQAVIMWIIASPLHAALAQQSDEGTSSVLAVLGFGLFWIGLAIETVADHQLNNFKKVNRKSNALLTEGLWSLSRHPNYFGESLLWWGLGLLAFDISGSTWSFAGPVVLTAVLIAVSGVLTDKHMARSRKREYVSYFGQTSGFLPLPAGWRTKHDTSIKRTARRSGSDYFTKSGRL